jgi:ribosomal protein S18 acetylase RimI-like enzyme
MLLRELILAKLDNAEELCKLINSAYRGAQGWTKETDIVSGNRTTIDDVKTLIKNAVSHLFVAIINECIVACVCVEEKEGHAYIGLLAVDPLYQNRGLGKKVLGMAEDYAITQLHAKELLMVVISQRKELIEYYERRGYKRTGEIKEYPIHLNVGIPMVEGLTIEYLAKST